MIMKRTKKNPISPPFLYLVIQKTVLAAINSNFVVDIKSTVLVFQKIVKNLQNFTK